MTREALDVYWNDDELPVGQVRFDNGETTFRYEIRTPASRRISHSLPVDDARIYPVTFFENLLPDGVQREALARRLGVSDTSTFRMLKAVGGDCAGALSLVPEGEAATGGSGPKRLIDQELVRELIQVGVVPTVVNKGLRLSLAGAQDKLPVIVDGNDLYLPAAGTASTHILKLSSARFRGVCSNEHFMLALANAVDVRAAHSKLVNLFGAAALLVERFDRVDGRRLHQEDICQALDHPPARKYEDDGGPTLPDIIALLHDASTEPGDMMALVRWQAFNIAAANNDGHAKNVALLREPRVRLAPAYDLVCTRAWQQLDKYLAFSVGGRRDAGNIGPRCWERFAEQTSLAKRAVLDEVTKLATAVRERAGDVAARVIDADGADGTAVRHALGHVREHATRTLRLMELEGRGPSIFKRARPRPRPR